MGACMHMSDGTSVEVFVEQNFDWILSLTRTEMERRVRIKTKRRPHPEVRSLTANLVESLYLIYEKVGQGTFNLKDGSSAKLLGISRIALYQRLLKARNAKLVLYFLVSGNYQFNLMEIPSDWPERRMHAVIASRVEAVYQQFLSDLPLKDRQEFIRQLQNRVHLMVQ